MMKQSLQLKVSQQLTLTPQLQQSIKLLQLSTLELHAEIERFLLENPLLERSEDAEASEGSATEEPTATIAEPEIVEQEANVTSDDLPVREEWGQAPSYAGQDEELDPFYNIACHQTLRQILLLQLGELGLDPRDHAIVQLLIEELDEDGYLTTSLDALCASLPVELELEIDDLAFGLALLQQFDPPGVGARSLQESLALQLTKYPADTPGYCIAQTIITHHLALLGAKDYTRLKKLLTINDAELRQAQTLIARLNPRPASLFDNHDTHYVVPDISVRKYHGRWIAELNSHALPNLRVNQMYAQILSANRAGQGNLSGQLQEARWLIKNIQQRFDTILKVSEAIVHKQQAFFEQGEVAMRPMILRDIADELGLHESTISRVTTQKYLLCPRGLFELKYFFGSALETEDGDECSSTSIKAHIRRLIATEDSAKPLSDSAIVNELTRQGIQVARRTVAKYRESLLIPPVSQRKKL